MRKLKFKEFIFKGIVPVLIIIILTWLGQYIYMENGTVDWFKACLVYGIPFGIPYMIFIIPIGGDPSGSICILVLNIILGAVFGCVIAGVAFIRAIVCIICYLLQIVSKHICHR